MKTQCLIDVVSQQIKKMKTQGSFWVQAWVFPPNVIKHHCWVITMVRGRVGFVQVCGLRKPNITRHWNWPNTIGTLAIQHCKRKQIDARVYSLWLDA